MSNRQWLRCGIAALTLIALSGCGGNGGSGPFGGGRGIFARSSTSADPDRFATANEIAEAESRQSTLFDLFSNADDPNTTVEVNKYIWVATLDILNFLPIESADPFSGVIVTRFGTPPGGGRAYRATVLIQDPALDARSLKLALMTSSGPASPDTVRAVEDAILTRARQLRIRDGKL